MVVRHRCDNRLCINPQHLEYGTQGDNLNDRKARHRYRKLTKEQVAEIRALIGTTTLAEIGRMYGVSATMIRHIKTGKQWAM